MSILKPKHLKYFTLSPLLAGRELQLMAEGFKKNKKTTGLEQQRERYEQQRERYEQMLRETEHEFFKTGFDEGVDAGFARSKNGILPFEVHKNRLEGFLKKDLVVIDLAKKEIMKDFSRVGDIKTEIGGDAFDVKTGKIGILWTEDDKVLIDRKAIKEGRNVQSLDMKNIKAKPDKSTYEEAVNQLQSLIPAVNIDNLIRRTKNKSGDAFDKFVNERFKSLPDEKEHEVSKHSYISSQSAGTDEFFDFEEINPEDFEEFEGLEDIDLSDLKF